MKFSSAIFLVLLLTVGMGASCGSASLFRAKGGRAASQSSTGATAELSQPENPKDKSSQNTKSESREETFLPAGTEIEKREAVFDTKTKQWNTNTTVFRISTNAWNRTFKLDESQTAIGGSQADVVGVTVAKLASMKWLQWVGVALLLAGIATATVPYLKLIVQSTTTSAMIAAAGAAMIVLPPLLVGQEKLILGACALIVALWFLAHRHGKSSGENKTLREFVDLNKNGIDDRKEKP